MTSSYLITFRKTSRSSERLIELPSEDKLLAWFAKTGYKCCYVLVQKIWHDVDE